MNHAHRILAALIAVSLIQAHALADPLDAGSQGGAKSREGDADRARTEEARKLYERAARAYAAKRNFEAIELFRQSAELLPSPLLLYNMGLAHDEAGDASNALKYFRAYLGAAPDAEDALEVRSRIERLEKHLADLGVQQMTVTSDPEGATVLVDDRAVGVTPYTAEFAPGEHAVLLRRPGYVDGSVRVQLPPDRAVELNLTLQATPVEKPPAPQPGGDRQASRPRDSAPIARVRPLTWSLLGMGAGSLTAGVLFEISRARTKNESAHAASEVDAAEARGAADGKRVASLVLLSAGGALTIAGGVLFTLEFTGAEDWQTAPRATAGGSRAERARVGCTGAFCGVTVSGSF